MRILARIVMAALGLSLLAMLGAWGFAAIGRMAGAPQPALEDSWVAAVGFAAMPLALVSLIALVLLGAAWVARDLLRRRARAASHVDRPWKDRSRPE